MVNMEYTNIANGVQGTHWCTKSIVNGQVIAATGIYQNYTGTPGIVGSTCSISVNNPCQCSPRFGGLNCEYDKADYCGYDNISYVDGSVTSTILPNPSVTTGVYTDVPLTVGQTIYTQNSCQTGTVTNIPTSVFEPSPSTQCPTTGGAVNAASDVLLTTATLTVTWGNSMSVANPIATVQNFLCPLNDYSFCHADSKAHSLAWCLWNSPNNYPSLVNPSTVQNVGCYTCPTYYFGRECLDTCHPSCPEFSTCQNEGGTGWALAPTGLENIACICNTNYTNAIPGTVPVEACTSCANEFQELIPACNFHGTCPIGSWAGPPFALTCDCSNASLPVGESYVDLGCTVPSKLFYSCGSNNLAFTCTYTGIGPLSSIDFRYSCQASGTLSENGAGVGARTAAYNFVATNMQLIQNANSLSVAQLAGSIQVYTTTMACPAIYQNLASIGNTNQVCPFPFWQFNGIGQNPLSSFFCDNPISDQYIEASANNINVVCYFAEQVTPSVYYQGTATWRCLSRQQDSTLINLDCSILFDRADYGGATGPMLLARTIEQTCISGS
jgi:hypothetical protein